jgi:hypothetical protein
MPDRTENHVFRQIYITLFNLIAPSDQPLNPALLALWQQRDQVVPTCLDSRTEALTRSCDTGFDPAEQSLPATAPAWAIDIVPHGFRREALIGVALLACRPHVPGSVHVWVAARHGQALHVEHHGFQFTGTQIRPGDAARLRYPVLNGIETIRAGLSRTEPILVDSPADQHLWQSTCPEHGIPEAECRCSSAPRRR